ncbi:MAG: hypothetical protein HPY61_13835 [Methanotrichaceae archaeon]|nr:hypothetical protein [Methanotrichaceae archaeon]
MESAIDSHPEAFGRKPSWMVEQMRAEAESIKAAADQTAAQAMGEACRLNEKARKMPQPQETEGKFEIRFAQALVEIMTGRATIAKPDMIRMPEPEKFEPLALVLSSTEQFYYRVTASFCPCQGWYWSNVRYGIGKCRHHTLAFPEIASENARRIEQIKTQRKTEPSRRAAQ